jgi:hypothetical protein
MHARLVHRSSDRGHGRSTVTFEDLIMICHTIADLRTKIAHANEPVIETDNLDALLCIGFWPMQGLGQFGLIVKADATHFTIQRAIVKSSQEG